MPVDFFQAVSESLFIHGATTDTDIRVLLILAISPDNDMPTLTRSISRRKCQLNGFPGHFLKLFDNRTNFLVECTQISFTVELVFAFWSPSTRDISSISLSMLNWCSLQRISTNLMSVFIKARDLNIELIILQAPVGNIFTSFAFPTEWSAAEANVPHNVFHTLSPDSQVDYIRCLSICFELGEYTLIKKLWMSKFLEPFFRFSIIKKKDSVVCAMAQNSGGFQVTLFSGPVGSIIYADLYGSIKIKFTLLIRDTDQ